MNYIIVFIDAGIGGALRHGVNSASVKLLGVNFPWGTLTVNVLGCLIMGLLAGNFAFKGETTQAWRMFLTTGILGGFTTFSAFSLDTVVLDDIKKEVKSKQKEIKLYSSSSSSKSSFESESESQT